MHGLLELFFLQAIGFGVITIGDTCDEMSGEKQQGCKGQGTMEGPVEGCVHVSAE